MNQLSLPDFQRKAQLLQITSPIYAKSTCFSMYVHTGVFMCVKRILQLSIIAKAITQNNNLNFQVHKFGTLSL